MVNVSCLENCYIAAVWLDTRTAVTVADIIARTPGHNQDHLRVNSIVLIVGEVIFLESVSESCHVCQLYIFSEFILAFLPLVDFGILG